MPKLSKRSIRYVRTDGRTDPNYRKASLSKIFGEILFREKSKLLERKAYRRGLEGLEIMNKKNYIA